MTTPLVDGFGRVHRDLRISVTDRCNFRCAYCMPEEGMQWQRREDLLSFEEFERVARIMVERHGVDGIRLTGGEPTVRARLPILVEKLAALGVDLALDEVATPLFLGLATDTGWFRFSSAGPEVYRVAARLMDAGVDKDDLFAKIEQNASPARLAMIARALGSLRYMGNGAVAVMRLTMEDFAETGSSLEGLAGIVNTPLDIGAVRASILLTEAAKGLTKVSFRSKPAREGLGIVDVNQLASRFGGGGHVHAAGARIQSDLDEAEAAIEAAVDDFVD